ncbi:MAG: peptidoglycan DD-metalloendopeptidase family protein [Micrococcus sp.]|nr:peptidoglycan DD-metalloendopeptidase family protein [Micrococcus sp.]
MSRRWTPVLATTTALAVLAATGGMSPGGAAIGGQPERATAYLTPSPQEPAGTARADVVSATDAAGSAGLRADLVRGMAERSPIRLVQSSSQDVLDRYAGEIPAYVYAGPLAPGLAFDHPVAGAFTLSSAFGWRLNPTDVGPALQFHIGLDYAVACGTPVRAAADGTIVSAGERGTGGLRVDVDHGDGLVTSYRHNSRLLVSPGDRVSRWDVISLSGTTGNSTGCHLHFDATLDGQYVDPVQLLPTIPGQPRPLDAKDLERIRAAAEQTAPRVRTPDADEHATRTPAPRDQAQGPKSPAPTERPAPPRTPSDRPAPKPSGTATPAQPKPSTPKPATPKPATSKPAGPQPTTPRPAQPDPARPTPGDSGTPADADPTEPTGSATPEPEPSKPAVPEPTEPASPAPTKPATPQPTKPASPEPTTPASPEPTTPASPAPSEPATPEPEPATPLAPGTLTDEQAAQWCLPLDDAAKAPDFSELLTGGFAELVGLVAVLDEDALPEPVTEETLIEVSPSAVWLESLPACSDAEFVEAALAARSAG